MVADEPLSKGTKFVRCDSTVIATGASGVPQFARLNLMSSTLEGRKDVHRALLRTQSATVLIMSWLVFNLLVSRRRKSGKARLKACVQGGGTNI